MLVKCAICGTEFDRKPGKIKIRNYCSRKCLGAANAERYRQQRIRTCDNCGKVFEYSGHHKKRNKHCFCCAECGYEYKIKQIEVMCDLCGKPFMKKRSDIARSKHNFCCEECYRNYISLSKEETVYSGKPLYRLIIEHKIGRELTSDEEVHHVDGNHNNNDPANLLLVTKSEHMKIHASKKPRGNNGQFIRGGIDEI